MIVFKDVLQLDEKEAREVKRWAIRVLIEAARGRGGAAGTIQKTRPRAAYNNRSIHYS